MISQLGAWLAAFMNGYVAQVVNQLTAVLVGIALIWLTIKIALYGLSVMRGEVSTPLETFAWDMSKNAFTLGIALAGGFYMANIFPLADAMQDGMANVFMKAGAPYASSAPTTVYGSLDRSFDDAMAQVKIIWQDAKLTRLDLVWASILFALGAIIFICVGTLVTVMSKMLLAFALAVGPIAILTLMFKPTAKFFDAWLSFVLSAVVLSWFVFFALGMSFFVSDKLMEAMIRADSFSAAGLVNAIETAATYDLIVVMLAVILWHAPSYAAQLTGGPAVQSGGALVSAGVAAARMSFMSARSSTRGGSSSGGSVSNAPIRNASNKAANDPRPMHEKVADAGAAKLEARRNSKEEA